MIPVPTPATNELSVAAPANQVRMPAAASQTWNLSQREYSLSGPSRLTGPRPYRRPGVG